MKNLIVLFVLLALATGALAQGPGGPPSAAKRRLASNDILLSQGDTVRAIDSTLADTTILIYWNGTLWNIANAVLTGDTVASNTNIYVNQDGADADAYIYFFETNSTGRYLKWDNTANAFEINDVLTITDLVNFQGGFSNADGVNPGFGRWYEGSGDGTNYFSVAAQAMDNDYTFVWPINDGDASEVLTTDGDGNLSWSAGGSGSTDSIAVDTDGNGTIDSYLSGAGGVIGMIRKGSNITLTVDTDTLYVAGDASAGTADSLGVDTDGNGTVDNYLYSTSAGAMHIKKGNNITLTVAGDTVTIVSVDTVGMAQDIDATGTVDINNYGIAAPGKLIHSTGDFLEYTVDTIAWGDDGESVLYLRMHGTGAEGYMTGYHVGFTIDGDATWAGNTVGEAYGGTGDTDLDDIVGGTGITVTNGANTVIAGDATVAITDDGIDTNHFAARDWTDMTVAANGNVTLDADVVAAAEMADADHGDVAWSSGVATVEEVTISDDESTDDDQEIVFTTDNAALESDGDAHYNPSTGTLTSPIVASSGGTSGTLTLQSTSSGTVALTLPDSTTDDYEYVLPTSFASAGYQLTDIAGDGVLSWAAASGAGADFADVLGVDPDGGDIDQTSLGRLEFYDAGLYLDADADGVMDVTSDGTLELHSSTWDISTAGVATTLSIDADANTLTNLGDGAIDNNITIDLATLATNFTCTDNEATSENNPIVFVDGATGTQGGETDGDFTYNPSAGKVTVPEVSADTLRTNNLFISGDSITDFAGSNLSVTDGVLNAVAVSVAYDNIGNPDANGSIAMGAYTGTYTSATDGWGGLWITNTVASMTSADWLLSLSYTDDGDADADFFRCMDNVSDVKFSVAQDGDVTTTGDIAVAGTVDTVDVGALGATVALISAGFDTSYTYLHADSADITNYTDGSIDLPDLAPNSVDSTKVVANSLLLTADIATFTSANLATNVTDETGTGVTMFNESPTITTLLRLDGNLQAEGNLYVNKDSTAADAVIYFGDDDEIVSLRWDYTSGRFEFDDVLYAAGFVGGLTGDVTGSLSGDDVIVDSASIDTLWASRVNVDSMTIAGNLVTTGLIDTVDVAALAATVHEHVLDTLWYNFNLADPDALYAVDHEWAFDMKVTDAITILNITVSLNADPTTEMEYSIVFADALIGLANATVVEDTATVAGVTAVTSITGDATVPADKVMYLLFDADPDDAITQAGFKIGYTVD